MILLVLFASFQAAWFANVLGGAHGLHWPGVLGSALLLAFLCTRDRPQDVLFRAALGIALGAALDGSLLATGWVRFPAHAGAWVPLWMLSLWASFAAALPLMTPFLAGRRGLAVAFGAVGGPAAYFSAEALGAVELTRSLSLAGVALAWAIAMLVLPLERRRA